MDMPNLNNDMIDGAEAKEAQAYADQFGTPGFEDPRKFYIDQHYSGYSEENQEVWQALYDGQMTFLADRASDVYLDGARAINLVRDYIPHLQGEHSINRYLKQLTGWESCAVPGYLPAKAFFACLSRREFQLACTRPNLEFSCSSSLLNAQA